ncbi:MAG: serine protease [Hyphomicrobiaceae bacterium]
MSFQLPSGGTCAVKYGTGFVIDHRGYAITAAHVLQAPQEECPATAIPIIEGRLGFSRTGEWISADSVSSDTGLDVALLKFAPRQNSYIALHTCSHSPMAGQEFVGIGFPEQRDLGNVRSRYQNDSGPSAVWVFESPFTFGMSGGPIVNEDGSAIAIIKGGLRNTQAVRYAIPLAWASHMTAIAGVSLSPCASSCRERQATDDACITRVIGNQLEPVPFSAPASVRCPGGGCFLQPDTCNKRETYARYDAPTGFVLVDYRYNQGPNQEATTGQLTTQRQGDEVTSASVYVACHPPTFVGAPGGWNNVELVGSRRPSVIRAEQIRAEARRQCATSRLVCAN